MVQHTTPSWYGQPTSQKNIFNGKKKVEETFRRTTEEDTSSRTDGHGIDVVCRQ